MELQQKYHISNQNKSNAFFFFRTYNIELDLFSKKDIIL